MLVKLFYIYCDCSNCPRGGEPFDHAPAADESIPEQRDRARLEGWRRWKGSDYCPDCWERIGFKAGQPAPK